MPRPVFGQGYPPLDVPPVRERPCPAGRHLVDRALNRCTECRYFLDDLCPVEGCREVTYAEVCDMHAAFIQPEATA